MRAHRRRIAFDCLDTRLVLDGGGAASVSVASVATNLVPQTTAVVYNTTIIDPGLLGDDGGDDSGGSLITDPGLLG